MKFEVGEIYLTKFHPGFGAELEKFRPAVIVATREQHTDERFITICAFTTRIKPQNEDLEIVISNSALEKESLLLTWYLRTIDTRRLIYKLGKLTKEEQQKMKTSLKILFS